MSEKQKKSPLSHMPLEQFKRTNPLSQGALTLLTIQKIKEIVTEPYAFFEGGHITEISMQYYCEASQVHWNIVAYTKSWL